MCIEAGGPPAGTGCGGCGRQTVKLVNSIICWMILMWLFSMCWVTWSAEVLPRHYSTRSCAGRDGKRFRLDFAMNRIAATVSQIEEYAVRLGGVIANRSAATDEIDRFNEAVGLKRLATFPIWM